MPKISTIMLLEFLQNKKSVEPVLWVSLSAACAPLAYLFGGKSFN
jgi:hypothetical protein